MMSPPPGSDFSPRRVFHKRTFPQVQILSRIMFFQVIHRRSSAGGAEAKISHRRYGAGLSILLALLRSAKLQPKDVASTANGGLSARPALAGVSSMGKPAETSRVRHQGSVHRFVAMSLLAV